MSWVMGLDIGSVGVKSLAFDGQVCHYRLAPTSWNPREAGQIAIEEMTSLMGGAPRALAATGYGRHMVTGAKRVTEITCHGRGAAFLSPGAGCILDIGGQDSKVICLDAAGNVGDFLMNDRCAAGTGRFVQMAAVALGYELSEMLDLPLEGEVVPLSSTCAVFAETELVSALAQGAGRQALALGIFQSIANRSANMLKRVHWSGPLFFSGGLSRCAALKELLARETGAEVRTHSLSQWAGALGAALSIF